MLILITAACACFGCNSSAPSPEIYYLYPGESAPVEGFLLPESTVRLILEKQNAGTAEKE